MMEFLTTNIPNSSTFLQLLADWPSVTSGGARFVHTVRTFLVEKQLPLLQDIDSVNWPGLQSEQYLSVRFGRKQVAAQPSPTDPVQKVEGFAANPGVGPLLEGPVDLISNITVNLKRICGDGVCIKTLLIEFIRLQPSEGRALLKRLEESPSEVKKVLGKKGIGKKVSGMREVLACFNMMPDRLTNWVDPFHSKEQMAEKVKSLVQRALQLSADLKVKAAKLAAQSRQFRLQAEPLEDKEMTDTEMKKKAEKAETLMTQAQVLEERSLQLKHHAEMAKDLNEKNGRLRPLFNLLSSRIKVQPRSLDKKQIRTIGAKNVPKKRQWLDPAPEEVPMSKKLYRGEPMAAAGLPVVTTLQVPNGPKQNLQSSVLTQNNGTFPPASSANLHMIKKTVNENSAKTRMLSATGFAVEEPLHAKQSLKPQLPIDFDAARLLPPIFGKQIPAPLALAPQPNHIYLIGFEHALQLGHALRSLMPHLSVKTIHLNSWSPQAVNQVADTLQALDLASSIVVSWLHDDEVFVQSDLGIPLARSNYDSRLHCPGRLGTISRAHMETVCELTSPILEVGMGVGTVLESE